MNRHQDATTWHPPAYQPPARPGTVRLVAGVFWYASAASVAIGVVGIGVTLATDNQPREAVPFIVAGALFPWAIVATLFTWVVYRRALALVCEVFSPEPAPEPIHTPDTLRVEVARSEPDGRVTGWQFLDIPGVSAQQLRQFAQQAVTGSSLAVNAWCGRGKPFTRNQYDALMQSLARAGLVASGTGNTGRQLTHAGRAVLRRIVRA